MMKDWKDNIYNEQRRCSFKDSGIDDGNIASKMIKAETTKTVLNNEMKEIRFNYENGLRRLLVLKREEKGFVSSADIFRVSVFRKNVVGFEEKVFQKYEIILRSNELKEQDNEF